MSAFFVFLGFLGICTNRCAVSHCMHTGGSWPGSNPQPPIIHVFPRLSFFNSFGVCTQTYELSPGVHTGRGWQGSIPLLSIVNTFPQFVHSVFFIVHSIFLGR